MAAKELCKLAEVVPARADFNAARCINAPVQLNLPI